MIVYKCAERHVRCFISTLNEGERNFARDGCFPISILSRDILQSLCYIQHPSRPSPGNQYLKALTISLHNATEQGTRAFEDSIRGTCA